MVPANREMVNLEMVNLVPVLLPVEHQLDRSRLLGSKSIRRGEL